MLPAGGQLRIRLPQLDYTVIDRTDRSEAHNKSIDLLRAWLSPIQLTEYDNQDHFTVRGSDTGTNYRLIPAYSYNILELGENGEPNGQKFCVVPAERVAMGDQLLAQKIWLETDERATLKIANKLVRSDRGDGDGDNNRLSLAEITREAMRLFRNSSTLLQNINAQADAHNGECP